MKVFVSYSRADVAFADQLVVALEDRGFEAILDRHDIDAAENWKARLGGLILSCDAVAFVLTPKSAGSPICAWEVEEAKKLGKRIVPVVPGEVTGDAPPALADLNWIHFYATPAIPGSGMFDGLAKLVRALKVDLAWLREQTRLSERAAEWRRAQAEDRLLRGAALREAQDWLGRAPKDASVPASVHEYLAASADAEHGREAVAKAQLEERETALKTAEKAQGRVRRLSLAFMGVGAALVAVAGWALVQAAQKSVEAGENAAALYAQASQQALRGGDPQLAAMIAAAGDPEASGMLESLLRPDGYPSLRGALVEAYSADTLVSRRVLPMSVQEEEFSPDDAEGDWNSGYSTLAAMPDGKHFLAFKEDLRLQLFQAELWEAGKATPIKTYDLDRPIAKAIVLPDGDRVVTNGGERFRVWSLSQGKEVKELAAYNVRDFDVDPSGRTAIMANCETGIHLLDLETGAEQGKTYASGLSNGCLERVAWAHVKDQLFAAGGDGYVAIWEAGKPEAPIRKIDLMKDKPGGFHTVTSLAWDYYQLVIGQYAEPPLFVHAYQDKPPAPAFEGYSGFTFEGARDPFSGVSNIVVSPDGESFVLVSTEWKAQPKLIKYLNGEAALFDAKARIRDAIFLPGANALAGIGPKTLSVWKSDSLLGGQALDDTESRPPHHSDHAATGGGVTITSNAETLGYFRDETLNYRLHIAGKPPRDLGWSVDKKANVVAVSRTGKWTALQAGGTIYVMQPDAKTPAWTLEVDKFNVRKIAFSADEMSLLTTADKKGVVWNLADGKQRWDFPISSSNYQNGVALNPDGTLAALAFEDSADLWRQNGAKGENICPGNTRCLDVAGGASAVVFNEKGDELAIGRSKGGIQIHGSNGALIRAISGAEPPTSITFNPDGTMILASYQSKKAVLWSAQGGQQLQVFGLQQEGDSFAGFDPVDQHVLVGTYQLLARVAIDPLVAAPVRDKVKLACQRAAERGFTGFTPDDRARFPIIASAPDNPCVKRGLVPPPPRKASELLRSAIDNPKRPKADVDADARRNPSELLPLAGIRPGMTIGELKAGDGYMTRLISGMIGPEGRIYVLDPAGGVAPELNAVLNDRKIYPNASLAPGGLAAFKPAASLDMIWSTEGWDKLFGPDPKTAEALAKQIHAALKPGGVFAVLGPEDADIPPLVDALHAAGFEVYQETAKTFQWNADGEKPVGIWLSQKVRR